MVNKSTGRFEVGVLKKSPQRRPGCRIRFLSLPRLGVGLGRKARWESREGTPLEQLILSLSCDRSASSSPFCEAQGKQVGHLFSSSPLPHRGGHPSGCFPFSSYEIALASPLPCCPKVSPVQSGPRYPTPRGESQACFPPGASPLEIYWSARSARPPTGFPGLCRITLCGQHLWDL